MPNSIRYLSIVLVIAFVVIAGLIVTTIPEMLSLSRAEESKEQTISTATTTKTKATIEGISGPDQELVLRVEDETQSELYEWVISCAEIAPFIVTVEFGTIVPLSDNEMGEGLVFTVRHSSEKGWTATGTTYIAMSEDDPLPAGTVNFRAATETGIFTEKDGTSSVIIADIVRDDGTKFPLTMILRSREKQ